MTRGRLPAGHHTLKWSGVDRGGHQVASGTYIVRLRANEGEAVRKIAMLR